MEIIDCKNIADQTNDEGKTSMIRFRPSARFGTIKVKL